jgi:L-iditol 2-dehydrogenase
MGAEELALPLSRVQERELVVTGTFRYAHTWPAAIALASSGRIALDRLVTGHFGLDEVEGALTAASRDPAVLKPVVRPHADHT